MGYVLFSKTQMKVVMEIKIAICRARETLLNPKLGGTAQPAVPPVAGLAQTNLQSALGV